MTHSYQYIIAGNWKMFKTVDESISFVKALKESYTSFPAPKKAGDVNPVEIIVFPPFTSLYALKDLAAPIRIGAQDMHFAEKGAFTGAISPLMLKDLAKYILAGHSERRTIFKETDDDVNKKIKTALQFGFTPVMCIGESLEERQAGKTMTRIRQQLEKDLEGLTAEQIEKIVIAYEPIWAIGTGINATPGQAQEVHAFIREILKEKISQPGSFKILYGGSVKADNSLELLQQNDINGVLVGGASLKIEEFSGIIQNSFKLINR